MYASASMNRTSARPGKRDNVQRTGARGYLAIFLFVIAGCTTTNSKTQIDKMLDDWHDAAAKSDESRYFAHFADNAVFLGTDATERWNVPAFRAYAHPYFLQGKGWA